MNAHVQLYTTEASQAGSYICGVKIREPEKADFNQTFLVQLPLSTDKFNRARAELITLQHILLHANLFGLLSGASISITVSHGQCKKGIQRRSAMSQINQLGASLRMVLDNGSVEVNNRQPAWFEMTPTMTLKLSSLYFNTHLPVHGIMGEVKVTSHAVDQMKAHSNGEVSFPLKAIKRLLNTTIHQVALPAHVMKAKLKKYGDNSQYWSSSNSDWVFVVANNSVIVTCYRKDGVN
ncbi:hypothetical protein [Vibrio sp. 1180_3]|uniref:hypothetical protein n=1 Tax=Vibrio sp. 1180_3 TaxID=2528832 RepID=UPI002404DAC6|nr:hypothetical protein [Vibrio sp. 1180_3]MDF9399098.1 hypothetical protein [Vibrio sp. 1180_3]